MRKRRSIAIAVIVIWSLALVPLAAAAIVTDPVLADRIGVSDQVSTQVRSALRSTVGDAAHIVDQATTTLQSALRPSVTDGVGVADQVSTRVSSALRTALTDAGHVIDSVTATLLAAFQPSLNGSVMVTDALTIVPRLAFRPAPADAVSVMDQVSVEPRLALRPMLGETTRIHDTVTTTLIPASTARVMDLTTSVNAASLSTGIRTSLLASLGAARSSLINGRTTAACGQLGAFVNEVQAQSGKAIPASVANDLLATAARALASVPCR